QPNLWRCEKDEEFVNCAPRCPQNCRNIRSYQPCLVLTPVCAPGCVCRSGKVKNDRGDCVSITDCFK
uniref:Venom peptide CtAPI n=1 Tax=Chaerilus tricostatus TaxID=1055734 RepID=TILI_CHATC|nr:RecName: Full=Venom peptide CtAPI; AltName: Full=Ascaris-type protease inhibitor [Chaerilus tricostatus]